jgi:DNA-binding transcriptional ArsR family regulator
MHTGRPAATGLPDPFEAIAHPVRRGLLDQLARGEQTVNALAAPYGISRPAISQHLQILRQAELVTERRVGRARLYRLQPQRLREVREWLDTYERFWQDKLVALEAYLEEQHGPGSDRQ